MEPKFTVKVVANPEYEGACGDLAVWGTNWMGIIDMSGHCQKAMDGLDALYNFFVGTREVVEGEQQEDSPSVDTAPQAENGLDLMRQCADKIPTGSHAAGMIIEHDTKKKELKLTIAGEGDVQCLIVAPDQSLKALYGPDIEEVPFEERDAYLEQQRFVSGGIKPGQKEFVQETIPVSKGDLMIAGSDGLFKCFSVSALQAYFSERRGDLNKAVDDFAELIEKRNLVELSDDMARVEAISDLNRCIKKIGFPREGVLVYRGKVLDDITVVAKIF